MSDPYGMPYLKNQLSLRRSRVNLRYRLYEMKNFVSDLGLTKGSGLAAKITSCLGWCSRSVDTLADRLVFKEGKKKTSISAKSSR